MMLVTRRCVGAALKGKVVSSVVLPSSKVVTRALPVPGAAVGGPLSQPASKSLQRKRASKSSPGKETREPKRNRRTVRGLVVLASAAQALSRFTGAGIRAIAAETFSSVTYFSGAGGVVLGGLGLSVAGKAIRRWHARRAFRKSVVAMESAPATRVTVVTFNLRGIMDRWPERAPLLRQCLKSLDADVFCFQEVLTGEYKQERQLLGPDYHILECRAALHHLESCGGILAAYSSLVRSLLSFWPTRSVLLSLPHSVESWRERYQLHGSWSQNLRDLAIAPFFGNSIATRLPPSACAQPEVLLLGSFRAAQRVLLTLQPTNTRELGKGGTSTCSSSSSSEQQGRSSTTGGVAGSGQQQQHQQQGGGDGGGGGDGSAMSVWLVNMHLDHSEEQLRAEQAKAVCEWMEPLKPCCAGIVMTGDLNAHPEEKAHALLSNYGYRSTHKVVHGTEPAFTWPSGLKAPLMDVGEPHCADYIYLWQSPTAVVGVGGVCLAGQEPAAGDPSLYPSDHIGLKVQLQVARRPAADTSSSASESLSA